MLTALSWLRIGLTVLLVLQLLAIVVWLVQGDIERVFGGVIFGSLVALVRLVVGGVVTRMERRRA